ncbi:SDR family oxidoreductase [Stigmatella erecta]|uniref:NAD(P)H dehydrogenase (Quinone) n=1 Tax=Stigmatella erecta TaxID=83460 RepID=A0A1I0L7Y4_9BACT|nr:SDR family oxidoreductase [Stigmatella erecta]SEU36026.1 NAD(P)H dehydrogenase (quinone) [Stigmatella erecta]
MILVTGATGHLGLAVIRQLLTRLPADRIAALVRDRNKASALEPQGVALRVGDYDSPAALREAMRGVETVLLVSGTNEERALQQHQNVVDAAKAAGVRTVAYTGRSLKDRARLVNPLMQRHFETEDYIRASGLDAILFRNALYMDTIPVFAGEKAFDTGIRLPAGEGRVAFALRSEQGEAIANVLAEKGSGHRTYRLTGPQAWSFGDVAATLSELSGKPVRYTPIEPQAFTEQMKARGMPEPQVQKFLAFQTDIQNGQEEETTAELETLLGRKPASLREGLKALFRL